MMMMTSHRHRAIPIPPAPTPFAGQWAEFYLRLILMPSVAADGTISGAQFPMPWLPEGYGGPIAILRCRPAPHHAQGGCRTNLIQRWISPSTRWRPIWPALASRQILTRRLRFPAQPIAAPSAGPAPIPVIGAGLRDDYCADIGDVASGPAAGNGGVERKSEQDICRGETQTSAFSSM